MAEYDYIDIDLAERLFITRSEILRLTEKIERLRAAGDALANAHVDDLCDCDQPECVAIRKAHRAWQEVRRG